MIVRMMRRRMRMVVRLRTGELLYDKYVALMFKYSLHQLTQVMIYDSLSNFNWLSFSEITLTQTLIIKAVTSTLKQLQILKRERLMLPLPAPRDLQSTQPKANSKPNNAKDPSPKTLKSDKISRLHRPTWQQSQFIRQRHRQPYQS